MISAQYGTVFTKSYYEKIQKVCSVWICMNPPKERSNTITEYSLTEKHHIGKVKEILENEFQIPMTETMETEVEYMCNLSDGVEQKGIEKGIEKEQLRLIQKKLEKNKSIEQIAEEVELDVESVKHYIEVLKEN